MQEEAFFFDNRSGNQLFAYQHLVEDPSSVGVVFCHPFGEEKTRSYRSLVNFGRFLAEKGIPSLRFDMKGAGDSDGEFLELTVESQVEDTMDAISSLVERTGVKKIVLIGLRLGATIASLTAEKDPRVSHLVLLSPILKGANYWREILRMKQFASIWLKQPAKKFGELMQTLEQNGNIEIEAQMLSHDFVKQLQSINLLEQDLNFSGDVLITGVSKDSLGCEAAAKLQENYVKNSRSCMVWSEEERDYWSVLSLFDQYHPQATYQQTNNWLKQNELCNA